jgi:hypothetical protein
VKFRCLELDGGLLIENVGGTSTIGFDAMACHFPARLQKIRFMNENALTISEAAAALRRECEALDPRWKKASTIFLGGLLQQRGSIDTTTLAPQRRAPGTLFKTAQRDDTGGATKHTTKY